MARVNGQGDIAREYRKKYGMEMPTLKLARIMYNENKLVFKDVENARTRLRYIEGKKGTTEKAKLKNTDFVLTEDRPKNPYALPKSDAKEYAPYIVTGFKRALIINDVHLPYHDIEAITTTFNYAKKEKPDLIVLNGDIIDCFLLSRFMKDPKARKFSYELDQLKKFVEVVEKTFKCKVIYKLGNHEIRYSHFLHEKAKEIADVEEFDIKSVIGARAKGVDIIDDKTIIKLSGLDLLHGHEFVTGFFNPVNVARGLYLRAKVSAMQGHSHKTSEHTETDLHGNIKTTWSVGCLCGLKADYAPYNSWNHGFALIDMDGTNFSVRNKRIFKGEVL